MNYLYFSNFKNNFGQSWNSNSELLDLSEHKDAVLIFETRVAKFG